MAARASSPDRLSCPAPAAAPVRAVEPEPLCPRCGAEMIWTKASWHCLACRYKEGCCG